MYMYNVHLYIHVLYNLYTTQVGQTQVVVSLARRSRMEGTSGDCSLLSVCKRNFINCVIDMLSRDKYEIIT